MQKKAWNCLDRGPTVWFCEPWPVHTGSDGCLVLALKRHRSSLFFPPLYGVIPPFFFNPLSKITLSLTLKPSINHSQSTCLCLSKKSLSILTLSSLNHSLVSASLPRRRRTVAAQPRFLPQSLLSQSLFPSLPSHFRSSAQISSSLSQSLNHYLVSASLPRQHRSSLSHACLCLFPSSPSQLTLCLVAVAVVGTLICFFFVNICKLIVDDDIDLKCWYVNWFGSIENWLWMMI